MTTAKANHRFQVSHKYLLKHLVPKGFFNIHPEDKSLFYRVFVWRTYGAMRKVNGFKTAHGSCHTWNVYECGKRVFRLKAELGEIHLCVKSLGAGVVSHEMAHGALGYARRVGIKMDDATTLNKDAACDYMVSDEEERFVWLLGNMVRQFYIKAYDRGIIRS